MWAGGRDGILESRARRFDFSRALDRDRNHSVDRDLGATRPSSMTHPPQAEALTASPLPVGIQAEKPASVLPRDDRVTRNLQSKQMRLGLHNALG